MHFSGKMPLLVVFKPAKSHLFCEGKVAFVFSILFKGDQNSLLIRLQTMP